MYVPSAGAVCSLILTYITQEHHTYFLHGQPRWGIHLVERWLDDRHHNCLLKVIL